MTFAKGLSKSFVNFVSCIYVNLFLNNTHMDTADRGEIILGGCCIALDELGNSITLNGDVSIVEKDSEYR